MLISCAYLSIYPMWRMIMSRLILELLVHTIPGKKSMPPWIHTKFEGGERGRVLKYVVKTCSKISPFLPFLGCFYDMYIKFVAKTELQIQINIFFLQNCYTKNSGVLKTANSDNSKIVNYIKVGRFLMIL